MSKRRNRPGRKHPVGRPVGYAKTGGIQRGQTWSRRTIADRIWAALTAEPQRPYILARRLHIKSNTVKATLWRWAAKGAVERLVDGYRRARSHRRLSAKDRPAAS